MKKKSEWLSSIKDCLNEGNIEELCNITVQLIIRHNQSYITDIIISLYCSNGCLRDARYAKFLSLRLNMINNSRMKKDPRTLTRIIIEIVTVLSIYEEPIHNNPPTGVVQGTIKKGVPKPQLIVTNEACLFLERLRDSHEMIEDTLKSLLGIKNYELTVSIENVAHHLCNDPLWYAWKILNEYTTFVSPTLKKYISNLFNIYRFKFRKACRKERLCLLTFAWESFWGRNINLTNKNFLLPVVIEASLKACYLYDDIIACLANEEDDDINDVNEDIISTMLL
jgi:hypothetical protein